MLLSPIVMFTSSAARRALMVTQQRSITTLIMGAPGGGKGTISKKLVKDFGFGHISTGDVLHVSGNSDRSNGVHAETKIL